ncbi:MAG: protoporphyrinogen oxidase HemJ [Rickettsiaceae bacterium]|nr:MAG: protoporphyrinogen oxidase HemJ [Rickettsiaceae bacterium]
MADYYLWFKALHIISIICWMAGIFYLPRLYVYHTRAQCGSELDITFQTMEYKLLKFVMNPAMISSYVFGIINASIYGFSALGVWFHVKMLAVIGLTIFHMLLAKWRKDFVVGNNKHGEKFYRIANEVPTILMVMAVFMVVIKPFD